MRILSVDLENIKSYRGGTVHLTHGLNAICGLNGSGKTTVLEAIGFALFDHLPYNQAAFVREGEKTGTIRIQLQAPDGRHYEVVRKVGSGSQYYVVDVESGTRLAERGPNVLDWVRSHALSLEGDADLTALFENAIGVPQGKMTSDFLGSTNTRKSIFDPLLRVEEYERAWAGLRETMSNLRDRSGVVREDIARLEGEVERIAGLEEQLNELRHIMQETDLRIADIAAELADVETQKAALDTLQESVVAREQELRGAQYDVARHGDIAAVQRQSLTAAQEARRITQASENGHARFVAAEAQLRGLHTQLQERSKLQQQSMQAKTAAEEIERRISELLKQRDSALRDAQAAEALAPDVARQEKLDEELREAAMRVREGKRLDEELRRLTKDIDQLARAIAAREQQISLAKQAREAAARLEETEARQRQVLAQLATIETLNNQLQETRDEGSRLRKQHDSLQLAFEQLGELRRAIDQRMAVAAALDSLRERERGLRDERIRIQATVEYQKVARADLEREHCPLLELKCPVVGADRTALARFDAHGAELAHRAGDVESELSALAPELDSATSAAQELQKLQVEAAKLESAEGQLSEARQNLERCRRQYQELFSVIEGLKGLEGERKALDDEIRRLRDANALAARLPLLEDQQKSDQSNLAARQEDRSRTAALREKLAAAEQEEQRLRADLHELGDPRARRQSLLATAAQLGQFEQQIDVSQSRLQDMTDRLRAVTAALSKFEGLDDHVREQEQIQESTRPDHERYLQSREEATKVEERETLLTETTRALEAARKAEDEARERLEAAVAAYDPALHDEVRRRDDELHSDLGAATTTREHLEKDLTRVEEDLAYLRRREQKLASQRIELDELGKTEAAVKFIRDTIRAAGPAVTETLLANISQIANDIYAEIMDDYAVELRWDRDYEVMVRRGPEDRKFAQLSGGEQMSAALAVRLALLKEMSEVHVAFFDEPTQNMDADRRGNLAGQISQIRGFDQLIVISHDDTFEHHTDNLIRLVKQEDETQVEVS